MWLKITQIELQVQKHQSLFNQPVILIRVFWVTKTSCTNSLEIINSWI